MPRPLSGAAVVGSSSPRRGKDPPPRALAGGCRDPCRGPLSRQQLPSLGEGPSPCALTGECRAPWRGPPSRQQLPSPREGPPLHAPPTAVGGTLGTHTRENEGNEREIVGLLWRRRGREMIWFSEWGLSRDSAVLGRLCCWINDSRLQRSHYRLNML
jgi:hypothetical protein